MSPRTRRVHRPISLLAALVAGLMLAACNSGSESRGGGDPAADGRATRLQQPRDALTEELMLALGRAKNYHGKADVYLKNGDVDRAIAEVERVLTIDFPPGAAEAEDVILDARARLATLLLGKGDVARARQIVDTGIDNAERRSFFLANLHTVRGEIIEAEAEKLAETDEEQARLLRLEALREYDMSLKIGEELQKKLVEESAR